MAQFKITANVSGTSILFTQVGGSACHIGISGNFGGGTITVKKNTPGGVKDLLDGDTAITKTAAFDNLYNLFNKDQVGFELSGATNPNLDVSITWE